MGAKQSDFDPTLRGGRHEAVIDLTTFIESSRCRGDGADDQRFHLCACHAIRTLFRK